MAKESQSNVNDQKNQKEIFDRMAIGYKEYVDQLAMKWWRYGYGADDNDNRIRTTMKQHWNAKEVAFE